ncbi:hypothetical protein N7495_003696 [Penicillium taxi]|uniref:uncharacterized protein n=1 Tax=Penicillium taxi TaxID=168475 RepID=UPI002545AFA8|nr:uncharacterized protein N7495_003696 [Penicillium taxi]KAJ5898952.1 hypothetical protein N7495_003696 [Penicillium taxi]
MDSTGTTNGLQDPMVKVDAHPFGFARSALVVSYIQLSSKQSGDGSNEQRMIVNRPRMKWLVEHRFEFSR